MIGKVELSTIEDLLRRYKEAHLELEEAEENLQLVEQRHGGGSGSVVPGQPISYLDVEHPEVEEAWVRKNKAQESVVELRRQLWDSIP